MAKVSEPWSARQQCQLAYISEFTTDIRHVAGKDNHVADCLSRAIAGAVHLGIDYTSMAGDQASDPEVQALRTAVTGLSLEDIKYDNVGATLLWFSYLLTMVDRTTRWPEAVPLASTTTSDVARAFIGTWVARFGPPSDVSSDRGPQFTSELWNAVAGGLGVRLHRTTAYHPQANGLCEGFHRSLKAALRASLTDDGWVDRLPWVMLGLRTAPKEDLRASSAELVYGQPLRVPGDFIPTATAPWSAAQERTSLQDRVRGFTPVPTSQHGLPKACVPPSLRMAGYVFIRHDAHRGPFRPPYNGPFRVLEAGDKAFLVDIGGRPDYISVDRLKPAHLDLDQPVGLALPPRRGRPPVSKPHRLMTPALPAVAPSAPTPVPLSRFGRVLRAPSRWP
ncbi:uncharacterized protein LOC132472359 [Gadus macrocephalus]|uniref:uncharacterized protein LOC132472359 n=1 Tax=Gadus macrocephalus TaxID=80720 RepID=UPI0028CBB222|nr:uncharacterized protein LOC132472359 [Gadus macrocephalus]